MGQPRGAGGFDVLLLQRTAADDGLLAVLDHQHVEGLADEGVGVGHRQASGLADGEECPGGADPNVEARARAGDDLGLDRHPSLGGLVEKRGGGRAGEANAELDVGLVGLDHEGLDRLALHPVLDLPGCDPPLDGGAEIDSPLRPGTPEQGALDAGARLGQRGRRRGAAQQIRHVEPIGGELLEGAEAGGGVGGARGRARAVFPADRAGLGTGDLLAANRLGGALGGRHGVGTGRSRRGRGSGGGIGGGAIPRASPGGGGAAAGASGGGRGIGPVVIGHGDSGLDGASYRGGCGLASVDGAGRTPYTRRPFGGVVTSSSEPRPDDPVAPAVDPLDAWSYDLPRARIATRPPARREDARLMVVPRDGGPSSHRGIVDLPSLLQPDDVLVVMERPGDLLVGNDSRVMPARLRARRETGGAVEVMLLGAGPGPVPCLLRPARRLKVGETLTVAEEASVEIVALPGEDGLATVRVSPDPWSVMAAHGEMPLPPYMERAADDEDRRRYQTVFAGPLGSVAAPTAGLHLTDPLLDALDARGVAFQTVTLHVGIGTFRPLRDEDLARGRLHTERWAIGETTADAVRRTRAEGGRVIAVGTTACRTLESAARLDSDGVVRAGSGVTDLFLRPDDPLLAVDGLLTNFHLPRSSLMMLVAAFVGRERLLEAYADAVARDYRFYSYGDAMLSV